MKKYILLISLLSIKYLVYGQLNANSDNYTNARISVGSQSYWAPISIYSRANTNKNEGVALAFEGTNYPDIGFRFKANGSNYYQVLYDGASINWKHYEGGNYVAKMSLSNSGFIGLNSTSPWAPITINTTSNANGNAGVSLAFEGTNYPEIGYRFKANGSNYYQVMYNGSAINWKHYEGGNYISKMSLSNSGFLGIGVTNPSDLLHLRGSNPTLRLSSSAYHGGAGGALNTILSTIKFSNRDDNHVYRSEIRGLLTGNWANHVGLAFTTSSGSQQVERMRINHDGTVGIGTASTFGYKLAVNGTIGATEVKVENTSAWPDFVFDKSYELRTLEEVEEHINKKGHLPEIPSESEVSENGINLGEMNAKLLQKIEELTLYLIEQNKQNQAQHKQLKTQATLIEQLQNEVITLKNK